MIEIYEKVAGQIAMSDDPGMAIRRWREEFKIALALRNSSSASIAPSPIPFPLCSGQTTMSHM